jgi:hypothetical protein
MPATQVTSPLVSPAAGLRSAEAVDAMLAGWAGDARASLPDLPPSKRLTPEGRVVQTLGRARYSHQAMADMLIADPTLSQNEIAAYFGRTPTWLSIVINSDAFQSYYAARKAEVLDPELIATVRERFQALTTRSLQVLQEKLMRPASEIPDNLALKAAELGAKSLGIGGNAPPPPPPNPAEYLPAIAERLMRLQGRAQQSVSDATIIEPPAAN